MNDKASTPSRCLAGFPVAFFAVVMGLAGCTLAWDMAERVFEWPRYSGYLLRPVLVIVFIGLIGTYFAKAARHGDAVLAEWTHPVKVSFFATISIGLVLTGTAVLELSVGLGQWLWALGALVHLVLTVSIMSNWVHHTRYEITHLNPAWFIPVVGNILVPIAGGRLGFPEVSWFFFSIGIVFWIVLFTIVMHRLFFFAPLPARLTPTLFILIAPPAAGFVSYYSLTGAIDGFARVLYYTAVFLALLLASNATRFFRTPFFLSAWAYSFPIAALTIATTIMAQRTRGWAFEWGARGLLAVLTVVVGWLAVRTVMATLRGEICREES